MEGRHERSLEGSEDRALSSTETASRVEVLASSDVAPQWPSVSLLDVCRPAFLPGVSQCGLCSLHLPVPHASTSGGGLLLSS